MTRIRTGIARRPDGPEDANPMNRRLPAEVVSRRKGENRAHPGKAAKEEVAPSHLSTDLKQVLAMKPEARSKWLSKAVQQAHPQDGRLSPKSIYEIIAHTKFVKDISEKLGQRMYRVLHANLSLFSTKQQKFLEKECALAKQFATAAFAPAPGAEEEEEVTTAADAMEDMMARCRAFVRERQSERGERNVEGEADAEDAVPQTQEAKQATQDEAAELREANEEMKVPEQPLSQAEPQKEEVDGHLTRASKSRSRSDDRRSIAQEAKTDPGEKVDVKASNPERKENGRAKETKDLKDSKASEKTKKPKDEGSKEAKSKPLKSTKEKAKEGRKRESHKRRSSSSQTSRRTREDSESSRGRRRSDKRRGKRSRNSSDSSSFDSRRRGRSSSSRPKRRR
eukprot:symbB.v1.2.002142.t1/scaffold106.1/size366728/30